MLERSRALHSRTTPRGPVTLGSGLLFPAMMFVTSAVGAGLAEAGHYLGGSTTGSGVGVFGQMDRQRAPPGAGRGVSKSS